MTFCKKWLIDVQSQFFTVAYISVGQSAFLFIFVVAIPINLGMAFAANLTVGLAALSSAAGVALQRFGDLVFKGKTTMEARVILVLTTCISQLFGISILGMFGLYDAICVTGLLFGIAFSASATGLLVASLNIWTER